MAGSYAWYSPRAIPETAVQSAEPLRCEDKCDTVRDVISRQMIIMRICVYEDRLALGPYCAL